MESITFGSLCFQMTAYALTIEYQVLLLLIFMIPPITERFDIFPLTGGAQNSDFSFYTTDVRVVVLYQVYYCKSSVLSGPSKFLRLLRVYYNLR